MKIKMLIAGILMAASLASYAATNTSVEGFDFNYTLDLAKESKLVQVFDDGDRTYFQFSTMEEMPTVYVEENGKKVLAKLESKPPYLIANGVAQKYILSEGKRSTGVRYIGKRFEDSKPQDVAQSIATAPAAAPVSTQAPAAAKPSKTEAKVAETKPVAPKKIAKSKPTSAPKHEDVDVARSAQYESDEEPVRPASADRETPTSGRRMLTATVVNIPFIENSVTLGKLVRQAVAEKMPQILDAGSVVVRGRASVDGDYDLARARSLAIRSMLIDNGVNEDSIEIEPISTPKAGKAEGFYLSEIVLLPEEAAQRTHATNSRPAKKPVDLTLKIKSGELISERLIEWAKRNQYALYWEAEQYRASADIALNKEFDQALNSFKSAMKLNGVNLDITIYSNRTIRVVEVN